MLLVRFGLIFPTQDTAFDMYRTKTSSTRTCSQSQFLSHPKKGIQTSPQSLVTKDINALVSAIKTCSQFLVSKDVNALIKVTIFYKVGPSLLSMSNLKKWDRDLFLISYLKRRERECPFYPIKKKVGQRLALNCSHVFCYLQCDKSCNFCKKLQLLSHKKSQTRHGLALSPMSEKDLISFSSS